MVVLLECAVVVRTIVLSVVMQMSHPQPPSVEALGYCGCLPGPTSVILPSRQDDGSIRAPTRACAVTCGQHK